MEKIALSNGKEVINFTPEIEGDMAIVHISVLKRITEHLIHSSFHNILDRYKESLDKCEKLEETIKVSEEFIAFHKTINLIQTYKK